MRALFHDPKDQAEYAYRLSKGNKLDPDLSYCFKKIDENITKMVCGDKFENWAKKYVEENYQRHLQNALDKAMEHHAKKTAFTAAKNMLADPPFCLSPLQQKAKPYDGLGFKD